MRKRTLGVVLLAGLAVSGGTAFTGANEMPADSGTVKAGYGAVAASGITVTETDYVFSTNNSALDAVNFGTSTNMTGLTARVTLTKSTASTTVVRQMDCTASQETTLLVIPSGGWAIQCDFATDVPLTDFDTVGLTVFSDSVEAA